MGTHLLRAGLIVAIFVTGALLGGLVFTHMRHTQQLLVRARGQPASNVCWFLQRIMRLTPPLPSSFTALSQRRFLSSSLSAAVPPVPALWLLLSQFEKQWESLVFNMFDLEPNSRPHDPHGPAYSHAAVERSALRDHAVDDRC